MINDGVKIVSLTEQISLMVKESIEDFIIETIEPYCSELAEIKISKEELKKVILKDYGKTGYWIDDEFGSKRSCCGIHTHLNKFNEPMKFKYCSMCGARMIDPTVK